MSRKKLSRPHFESLFIEMEEEIHSEKTLSDDEFDPNHIHDDDDDDDNDDDDDGWEINLDEEISPINLDEEISPSESASQISGASASTASSNITSSVWLYFDKNPAHTPGYNVCKRCSKKYQLSTSVTSLRKHLKTHQLKAPTKGQKIEQKKECALDKDEQEQHDKYLVRWLIRGLQPFTVVENPSFRAFINSLCSRYDIPDRHKAKGKFYLSFIILLCNI